MMTKKNKIIFTILCVLIIGSFGSCVTFFIYKSGGPEKIYQTFRGMHGLQNKISKVTDTSNINIKIINNAYITVAVINSKYNEDSKEKRKEVSKTIFDVVEGNYSEMKNISAVNIVFVRSKSIGFIYSTTTIDGFGFVRDNESEWKEKSI